MKLLTADQRKEIIRKRSLYNLHMVHRPQPLCKAHDGKLLEFYCELIVGWVGEGGGGGGGGGGGSNGASLALEVKGYPKGAGFVEGGGE